MIKCIVADVSVYTVFLNHIDRYLFHRCLFFNNNYNNDNPD